jgi:hypothetical protein
MNLTTILLATWLFLGTPIASVEQTTVISVVEEIPELNQKVIQYIDDHMDRKVDRGECWDLAAKSLQFAGATMPDIYIFGKEVDPAKDQIFPGDVIQMFDVTYAWGGMTSQHTCVVYEVLGDGKYKIAEQNVDNVRKVMINDFSLAEIAKGKVHFYRPQP